MILVDGKVIRRCPGQSDISSEALRQHEVDVRSIAPDRRPVWQSNLDWWQLAARSRGCDKSCATTKQAGKQLYALRARHLARILVNQCISTITHNPCIREFRPHDLFALHGFDREPPKTLHSAYCFTVSHLFLLCRISFPRWKDLSPDCRAMSFNCPLRRYPSCPRNTLLTANSNHVGLVA